MKPKITVRREDVEALFPPLPNLSEPYPMPDPTINGFNALKKVVYAGWKGASRDVPIDQRPEQHEETAH